MVQDEGAAERQRLSREALNAALLTDQLQNRVDQISSPNVLKVKAKEEGEDTGVLSPMGEDELFMQGSSGVPIKSSTESGTAAQLFSGQFAQALGSFSSPAKQTYGAHVDQNVWLHKLSG